MNGNGDSRSLMCLPHGGSGVAPAKVAPAKTDDQNEHPWRGLFLLELPQKLLFTQDVEFKTSELPRWEPDIVISRRSSSDE